MNKTATCRETFDDGPAGWWGWGGNHLGLQTLPHQDSYLETISPRWIDYNHAPPGGRLSAPAFPLDIVPMGDPGRDLHTVRPERDYPVWRSNLPEGRRQFDQFEIHYP